MESPSVGTSPDPASLQVDAASLTFFFFNPASMVDFLEHVSNTCFLGAVIPQEVHEWAYLQLSANEQSFPCIHWKQDEEALFLLIFVLATVPFSVAWPFKPSRYNTFDMVPSQRQEKFGPCPSGFDLICLSSFCREANVNFPACPILWNNLKYDSMASKCFRCPPCIKYKSKRSENRDCHSIHLMVSLSWLAPSSTTISPVCLSTTNLSFVASLFFVALL